MSVFFRKGISREAKISGISSFQAKKIQKALSFILSTPTEELLKSSKLIKITVSGRDDVYLYRVDTHQRIVLSINEEGKIIHSIVDASGIKINIEG